MERKELVNEIELFCNDAPDYSYLARFDATNTKVDTLIWVRCLPNIDAIVKNLPDSWDVIAFKAGGRTSGCGHFGRYFTNEGNFNKAFCLSPDDTSLLIR